MSATNKTPTKKWVPSETDLFTPPMQQSLCKELKQVLNERNLLTAKSRRQICRMLDPTSPTFENETHKRRSLRLKAVQEILSSERSYMKQLKILINFFVEPLKNQKIINDVNHVALFGQIEMIYNLNATLLEELEEDLDNVGHAFLKLAPFFKLYSVYAFDYKPAILLLQNLTERNSTFRRFLQDTESRPEVQMKLNALLIAPIQRIPRYRLLLQQVLLYTSVGDSDFKIIQDSIKEVENTASHINTVVEDQEGTQKLLNLQNSLVHRTPKIVAPSRKIIKEGILYKMSSQGVKMKRYCILLSDIFMYCKVLKDHSVGTLVENSLQCSCIFPLKKSKVAELFPGNFKLSCQGDGIIFCSDESTESRSWVNTIKETIELHIQCRKTLRKESSKRAPIRRKNLKYFESDEKFLSPTGSRKTFDFEQVVRCADNSDDENRQGKNCFRMGHAIKRIRTRSKPNTSAGIGLNKGQTSGCDSTKLKDGNISADTFLPVFNSTYVKQQTIDSIIPSESTLKERVHEAIENTLDPNYVDSLYPLRESNGSYRSTSSGGKRKNSCESEYSSTSSQKRVKFDETVKCRRMEPYNFHQPLVNLKQDQTVSLSQKLRNFFSKLFR